MWHSDSLRPRFHHPSRSSARMIPLAPGPGPGPHPPLLPPEPAPPRRYHGTVRLDPTRVGRDASQIAEEVVSHLVGLAGAEVTVTIEIDANLPDGASDHVVRTVTEDGRTLKFESGSGFERD